MHYGFSPAPSSLQIMQSLQNTKRTPIKSIHRSTMQQTTYKNTELGLIPEDWEVKEIRDICKIFGRIGFRGYTVDDIVREGDGAITISPSNILENKIDFNKCTYISWFKYEESPEIKIFNGDILLVKTGSTFGKTAIVKNLPIKATINPQLVVLKNISIDRHLLSYIMSFTLIQNQIKAKIVGGAIPTLSQEVVNKFKIPLPPSLSEQTAIATALSDTDALISSLEQLIAKKRAIKQGAMQELLRPKDGWEVKKLGEVAEIVGGGTPSTSIPEYWNGNIDWFTPTEIGLMKYTFESKRKISESGFQNCSAKMLPIGTILLTSRAGIGDVSILKCVGCTNQGFQSLIPKDGFNNEYLYYLVTTLKNELLKNASGSTFLEISPNKIKEIEIKISSFEDQTRIATILSDMDTEIETLEIKLNKYKQIKQGMMQQLLTGKIRLV